MKQNERQIAGSREMARSQKGRRSGNGGRWEGEDVKWVEKKKNRDAFYCVTSHHGSASTVDCRGVLVKIKVKKKV